MSEISVNPQPPPPPPPGTAVEVPNRSATAKRPRDEGDAAGTGGDLPQPKRPAQQDVVFRIMVPSRQIGKVIGKEGTRIQKIREETKATIKIADAIAVSKFSIRFYACFSLF